MRNALVCAGLLFLSMTYCFAQEGGASCEEMGPICSDSGLQFTANSGGGNVLETEPGNNYGCLGASPNPSWFYLEISEAGNIVMSLSAAQDIDFIIWGPYPNLAAAQANCGSHNNIVPNVGDFLCQFIGVGCDSFGCSYDPTNNETPGIPNAQVGQVYVMMISNYANQVQDISLTQTGGTGATDCSIVEPVCIFTELDADISGCDEATLTYSTTGTVTYQDPPEVGQLIVEDCNGNQQVFDPPFNGSNDFILTDQPANGETCVVSAYFTEDPSCNIETGSYTAPVCECVITDFSLNASECNDQTNTYTLTGSASFLGAPADGTLTVTLCNGETATFNPPFAGLVEFTFNQLPANGDDCAVTVSFSADAGCSSELVYTAPEGCICDVSVGDYVLESNGELVTDGVVELCVGEELIINYAGGFVPPPNINDPIYPYNPGVWLLLYSCPPTIFPPGEINDDPCLEGVFSTEADSWVVANEDGEAGTFYVVPLTMYDVVDGYYAVTNTGVYCYDLGPVIEVSYFAPIEATEVFDCNEGTATFTLTGGAPGLNGIEYTASDLSPNNAQFVNTTAGLGGDIVIEGLLDGQTYSFVATDDAGCTSLLEGGPFIAADQPTIDDLPELCAGDDSVQLSAQPAGGSWSASCGACITAEGVFDPQVAGEGAFEVTYQTPGECGGETTADMTVSELITPVLTPSEVLCAADATVQLEATPVGGTWSATCGNCITPAGVFNPQNSGTGMHEVSYALPGACGSSAAMEVSVEAIANSSFSEAPILCESSEPFTFQAVTDGGVWSASCGDCIDENGVFDPAIAGMGDVNVSYSIEGFCGSTSNASVEVLAVPDASILPIDPLCVNSNTVQLSASTAGGSWTADCETCVNSSGVFNPQTAGVGTHWLTYTITQPCASSSVLELEVLPIPEVFFTVDEPNGCQPHEVIFTNQGNTDGVIDCQWSFGNGSMSNLCDEVPVVYNNQGCYDVSLTLTSHDGCTSTYMESDMVCVYGYPTSNFTYSPVRPTFGNPVVNLTELSTGGATFEWLVDDEVVAIGPSVDFNISDFGTHEASVCLRVISAFGCEDVFCRTIELSESLVIYVPTAFTPDQDGINEVWVPVVTGAVEYECSVYNRWGERVFYSETPGEPWLGDIDSGAYFGMNEVYTWHLKVKGVDRDVKELRGHVVMIR